MNNKGLQKPLKKKNKEVEDPWCLNGLIRHGLDRKVEEMPRLESRSFENIFYFHRKESQFILKKMMKHSSFEMERVCIVYTEYLACNRP